MEIEEIDARLGELRDDALEEFDVPPETLDELEFAPPPDPEMGDVGFPCFALAPVLKNSPQAIAEEVAERIAERAAPVDLIDDVRAQGPYVNFALNAGRVSEIVVTHSLEAPQFGGGVADGGERWMIEFSAPNTNKPLHVGHVRNNLLGASVSTVVDFAGDEIVRTNLVNDRGIHICKSMVARALDEDGPTPEEAGVKGDHLVGDYYVDFNDRVDAEYVEWQSSEEAEGEFEKWVAQEQRAGRLPDPLERQRDAVREAFFETFREDFFKQYSDLGERAREMLRKWEDGDEEVRELWRRMNGWVYDGFEETYRRLGIEFDEVYYESETYEVGRDLVEEGRERGIFEERSDGAVVFDLERIGMEGEKVLLRPDGTTVYMTQDLGTAKLRFDEYDPDRMVFVVGDEQEYHFQVLFGILAELDPSLEGRLHHLSYGMVDLPEGKMKSREGKVVDADDLMDEMNQLGEAAVRERYSDLEEDEVAHRAEVIGQAALKFHLLDYNPRTNIQFNPEESIAFQGRTGPYCLYSYARVQSLRRRVGGWPELDDEQRRTALRALETERELEVVRQLREWPETVRKAYDELDPSEITDFAYHLAKAFSSLYNDPDHRIVDLEGSRRDGLLLLARATARTIETALDVVGIETLDEM